MAEWRTAADLWQRRSTIVPFRAVVRRAEYHPLIEATVAALVTERHLDDLSPEVIRRHTRHLPRHAVYKERKRQPFPGRRRSKGQMSGPPTTAP